MPVRLRITLLFTVAVFIILLLVCTAVFYISSNNRLTLIKSRLVNRANNTASLLTKSKDFNSELVQKMDSTTAFEFRDKEIQVYDINGKPIYKFSDRPGNLLNVEQQLLKDARQKGIIYFTKGEREIMALHYPETGLVIISATFDEAGEKYLAQLKKILLMCLLGGSVITLAVGYLFSARLLRPIKHIADEVNEISAKNLNRRIKTGKGGDEWFYLSQTLNNLLNRLQESFEVQRRFISNASHELSTPLTSVSNQLEVSLQRNRDAEEYRKVMYSVQQDILHMSKLTQTLLEFAKASGSAGGLQIEPVRIDELLLQVMQDLKKTNEKYTVKLNFNELPADESKLLVLGNEDLLLTAVKNVIQNACKYSYNQNASVQLILQSQKILIEITDYGPGIPAAEQENIFQPFYRTAGALNEKGFGLGLALSAQIIKLHKGFIQVKAAENNGAVFIISLPANN